MKHPDQSAGEPVGVDGADQRTVAHERAVGRIAADGGHLVAAGGRDGEFLLLVAALKLDAAEIAGVAARARVAGIEDGKVAGHRLAVEEVVPAGGHAAVDGDPIIGRPRAEKAGKGERRELHREAVCVEEVADGRHLLEAKDAIEVAETEVHAFVGQVAVELRYRQAVVLGEIPGGDVFDAQGLEVVGVPPQGRRVKRVGAEEQVGPNTPVKPLAAVGFPFGDHSELIELPLPGPVGHRHGAVEGGAPVVGTDAILDPAVGEDVAVFQTRQVDPAVWPAAIVGPLPGLADLFRRNVRFRRSLGRHG